MRDNIHIYFLKIADTVALRSTCDRAKVGAVIVRDKNILATGYNGSISGTKHCNDVGHLIRDDHCVRTIHAEMNAVIQSAKNGVSIKDSDIYITAFPCWNCFKVLANAGIKNIYFSEEYRVDDLVVDTARELGIKLYKKRDDSSGVISYRVFK